jgi:hypothetical protein
MSKKWIIIGGLVVLILLFLGTVLLSRAKSHNVCETMIVDAQDNKAAASYKLFTDTAKSRTSSSDWASTVSGLSLAFGNNKPTLSSQSTSVNATTRKNETTQIYSIKNNDGSKYTATCTIIQNGSSYQIDSFNSAPDVP